MANNSLRRRRSGSAARAPWKPFARNGRPKKGSIDLRMNLTASESPENGRICRSPRRVRAAARCPDR